MTAAGRQHQSGGLSIGAVLAQLRTEFPDVTISKIRFLESEGLVRPARTRSGYRQFSGADVERLKFVLSAQRDHYLPLKVIKEQLDAADDGQPVTVAGPRMPRNLTSIAGAAVPAPTADDFAEQAQIRMTREELLAKSGIDSRTLGQLEQFGLIKAGAAGFYDADAAFIAKTVQQMTEFGIEPRHLRAFRASADREVGLLEQIVTPVSRHRDSDARARADEVVRELAALSVTLHTLLVRTGIRGMTSG